MRRFVAPLIAALCLPAAAMAAAPVAHEGLARIEMQVETGFLNAEERQVVNLLIQAADEMTAIYKRQAAGQGPGHGFYPDGLTKAELDAYIAAHPVYVGPRATPAGAVGLGAMGSLALGAIAFGAFAVGVLAIGKLAVGRVSVGRARIKRLEIDELTVRRLTVLDDGEPPR